MMKKVVSLIVLLAAVHAPARPEIDHALTERARTNLSDAMLFTIAAKAVNDHLIKNPDQLSLLSSAAFGIGSWLCGEVAEAIYKEIYKACTDKTLRESLGSGSVVGVEVDFQRLLRRALTLVPLYIALRIRYQLAKSKPSAPTDVTDLIEQIELGQAAP